MAGSRIILCLALGLTFILALLQLASAHAGHDHDHDDHDVEGFDSEEGFEGDGYGDYEGAGFDGFGGEEEGFDGSDWGLGEGDDDGSFDASLDAKFAEMGDPFGGGGDMGGFGGGEGDFPDFGMEGDEDDEEGPRSRRARSSSSLPIKLDCTSQDVPTMKRSKELVRGSLIMRTFLRRMRACLLHCSEAMKRTILSSWLVAHAGGRAADLPGHHTRAVRSLLESAGPAHRPHGGGEPMPLQAAAIIC